MGLDSRDYYRPSGYGGFSFFPPVIKNLIIINVAVFFVQIIFNNLMYHGIPAEAIFNKYFALNPISPDVQDPMYNLTGHNPYNFQIWQLITYQFMHADITHILFNMFFLWMFGMEVENIMGSRKFLIFYLTCGTGAGLLQIFLPPLIGEGVGLTIGASGAIWGVMIAFAMYFPDRYILFWFLIPIKAKYLIAFFFIIEFLSIGNASLIAHLAHVGGALTGLIYILIDRKRQVNTGTAFRAFGKPKSTFSTGSFGKAFGSGIFKKNEVEDAQYHDINDSIREEEIITQEEIDRILDKISQSGYQNLTNREKKILFEASKRK